ncbi:MAG: hypothetical protein R6W91_04545 [Thermoplasmata archaeon]
MTMRPASAGQARLQSNCAAMEGVPLTLLITMVVLAITVPLIFGSLRAYDRARVETTLMSEIDSFISAVQLIYTSGPGNSAVIDFNAAPGSMTGIDYLAFGDEPGGGMASTIRYKVQSRPESMVPVSSPNVPMMSSGGIEFKIASGNHQIRAECISNASLSQSTFVLLELCQ